MVDSSHDHLPGPLVGGPHPLKVRSRRRTTRLRRAINRTVAPLVVALIKLAWASYRFQVHDEEPVRRLLGEGRPLILTFWHDSIFAMGWYLQRLGGLGARVTYLVSPSRDGDLAVQVLSVMGAGAVRGSATRSGVKAMHGLYRAIVREHGSPVVLPDGPHGPRHHCKPGSLLLAQMSGAQVLPMACAASRSWRLRTWDRLLVPLPFARVAVTLGEPYSVPKGIASEELERQRLELEARLQELAAEARRRASGGAEIVHSGEPLHRPTARGGDRD
jgi:lysophospholipid acyltransferase (LPLAT)-like uncharacterized protein